jgi:hypothetical protein
MAATIRNLLKLGIEDTPPAWEAVLGGFLLGIGVLVNAGPAIYVQLFEGRSAVQIPELLAYQFALAERWRSAGEAAEHAGLFSQLDAPTS